MATIETVENDMRAIIAKIKKARPARTEEAIKELSTLKATLEKAKLTRKAMKF